jgi:hypothetical protein
MSNSIKFSEKNSESFEEKCNESTKKLKIKREEFKKRRSLGKQKVDPFSLIIDRKRRQASFKKRINTIINTVHQLAGKTNAHILLAFTDENKNNFDVVVTNDFYGAQNLPINLGEKRISLFELLKLYSLIRIKNKIKLFNKCNKN